MNFTDGMPNFITSSHFYFPLFNIRSLLLHQSVFIQICITYHYSRHVLSA